MTASKYAVISFAGAVLAGCALGMAANAQAATNCDPFLPSMTPQPVLACQAPRRRTAARPACDRSGERRRCAAACRGASPRGARAVRRRPGSCAASVAGWVCPLAARRALGEHHYFELEIHLAGSSDAHTVGRLIDFPT